MLMIGFPPSAGDLLPGEVVLPAIRGRHLGAEGGRRRGEGGGVQEDPEPPGTPEENCEFSGMCLFVCV